MNPKSIEALKVIASAEKPLTVKQFSCLVVSKDSEALLNTILNSHVDLVKGKLVLNEAGKSLIAGLK